MEVQFCFTAFNNETVKNLLAMQEMRVRSLGWEDPLEDRMATRSSILASRIPWTEEAGGLQSLGSQRVRHDGETNTHIFLGKKYNWGASYLISQCW